MRDRTCFALFVLTSAFGMLAPPRCDAAVTVVGLNCEWRAVATDVDVPRPRFSWRLSAADQGARQAAYQLRVSTSVQRLLAGNADLWDSGRVASDDALNILYSGNTLASFRRYVWQVRVWDGADAAASPWSEPSVFATGLLNPADWGGRWITSPVSAEPSTRLPVFRKRFTLNAKVSRASISICGLGQFELRLNGRKVGDDVLQPGWTDFKKVDLYTTYDITGQLIAGENVIGVMLGNGMYNVGQEQGRYAKFKRQSGPLLLAAQLNLTYADGTTAVIPSDNTWTTTPGPVTYSDIYGGEDDDARLEPDGWDSPRFDDSKWAATEVNTGPGGLLRGSSRSSLPLKILTTLSPRAVTQPKPGVNVYDFGQNCSLEPKLTVHGPAGAVVKIEPGELLGSDGQVTQQSMGGPVFYTYTLRGGGNETWQPRFTYVGSRYLQVRVLQNGSAAAPATLDSLQACVVQSAAPEAGTFKCSSELFNRTATLIRWAQQSNIVSILTDCPHRERLGWLEQDHLNGPSLMDNFSLPVLLEKIAGDIDDAQQSDGLVPDIAPEYTVFAGGFRDSAEWGSAAVLVPWQCYQWYGDSLILADHYSAMKRYVNYLASKLSRDGLLNRGLGDWYDIGPKPPGYAQLTPIAFTATAFYCHDLDVLEQTARLLGNRSDASVFSQRRRVAVAAFNTAFYHPDRHSYATGSQTANAIPLVFGFAPVADRSLILEHLVQDVRTHGNAITAGDIGYGYLLRALADGDRSDVIFDLNSRSDVPGYGYQLAHGATSLTEAWDASPRSSQNHFMLGHIVEWFYSDLAGISQEPGSVAFKHVRIRPCPVGDVTWAEARYDSVRGLIHTHWSKSPGGSFTLDVTIPPGSTARVYVPAEGPLENQKDASLVMAPPGSTFVRYETGRAIYDIQAGQYQFIAPAR